MVEKVLVKKVEDYTQVGKFVREAFETFGFEEEDEVIIKPNFLKYNDPLRGCITHPSVVSSAVEAARDSGLKPLVAEGGFGKDSADKCFSSFNLGDGVNFVNLNREEFVKINVGGKALKDVKVAKSALKALNKPFISLPKFKVHHLTGVTLGIKNNMGFLKKPAVYMHLNIHQKLVDLLGVFNPSLVIIDGVVGGDLSESKTKPLDHGVMVASNNVVAADAVAAELMGFMPEKIEHIRLAAEVLGVDLDKIEANVDIERLKRNYSLSFFSRVLGKIGI